MNGTRNAQTPYYTEDLVTLYHGDCIEVMRSLPDNSVHAVVTDPPYGLEFMGKGWDGADGFRRSLNEADAGRESVFGRTSRTSPEYRTGEKPRGKISQIGDADGTPFRRGAGTPAWGASGNPACQNCGGQKYGNGNRCACDAPRFPNHMAAQMQTFQTWCEVWATECLRVLKPGGFLISFGGSRTWHRLASAVEDAGFEIRDSIAWLYGSGMPKHPNVFKPAFEPIVVARKPLIGTIAANVAAHGTGALNIDTNRTARAPGDRVEYGRDRTLPHANTTASMGTFAEVTPYTPHEDGRWPTNVTADAALAGELGDAARLFPAFRYQAKAPGNERVDVDGVEHPTIKPLDLMRWLVRLVTPPGGTVLEPFAGSGTTLEACLIEGFNVIGIEREDTYLPLILKRIKKPLQQSLFGDVA